MVRFFIISWSFWWCVLFVFNATGEAASDQSGIALSGLRGINANMRRGFSPSDMPKLRSWGVNLIRLNISADPDQPEYDSVYDVGGRTSSDFWRRLDDIVDAAGSHGIRIIIDMHTFPGYTRGEIWKNKESWGPIITLWREISEHYQGNKVIVGYDLINEPNIEASLTITRPYHIRRIFAENWRFPEDWAGTSRDYFQLVSQIARKINVIDPKKVIIVEGVGLGGRATNFIWMKTIAASNVVYSFHTYVPRGFGDSGKNGKDPNIKYTSSSQRHLLEADISHVEKFAKLYNVQIFVGEFGLTYYSEGKGAAEWVRDMVTLFERNGWSWAYWTYSIPFRNPEVLRRSDGTLERRNDTDRLTVLKEFWTKNRTQKAASQHSQVKVP